MAFLNYFLISLLAYLGLLVGIVISKMAEEELKPGKKYFVLAHNIILTFILFFTLEFLGSNFYLIIFLPLFFLIFLFRYTKVYSKSHMLYPILGGFFYISSSNNNHFLLMSSLIFFYGFLVAGLQYNKKELWKILGKNLLFFVCLALFFL